MQITKEYKFITSKAFLLNSKIAFNHKQYQQLGEMFALTYEKQRGIAPEKILAVNSVTDKLKVCSLYPADFIPTMEEITINYFASVVE